MNLIKKIIRLFDGGGKEDECRCKPIPTGVFMDSSMLEDEFKEMEYVDRQVKRWVIWRKAAIKSLREDEECRKTKEMEEVSRYIERKRQEIDRYLRKYVDESFRVDVEIHLE